MNKEMKMSVAAADHYRNYILENIQRTLGVKASIYVRDEDMMHNFNVGANRTGMIREKVLEGFRLKHEISREDILADIQAGKEVNHDEILEKYGDIINYYVLELMSLMHRFDIKIKKE